MPKYFLICNDILIRELHFPIKEREGNIFLSKMLDFNLVTSFYSQLRISSRKRKAVKAKRKIERRQRVTPKDEKTKFVKSVKQTIALEKMVSALDSKYLLNVALKFDPDKLL